MTIQVPTKLKVERGKLGLVVVADEESSVPAQISVDKNMNVSFITDRRAYPAGAEHREDTGFGIGVGMFRPKVPIAQSCEVVQWLTPDTVTGWTGEQPFVVEFEYCLMESPNGVRPLAGINETVQNAKNARVLWRKTLSLTVDNKSVGPEITYGPDLRAAMPSPQQQAAPSASQAANAPVSENPVMPAATNGKTAEASVPAIVKHLDDSISIIKTDALTGENVVGASPPQAIRFWDDKEMPDTPQTPGMNVSSLKIYTTPLIWESLGNGFLGATALQVKAHEKDSIN